MLQDALHGWAVGGRAGRAGDYRGMGCTGRDGRLRIVLCEYISSGVVLRWWGVSLGRAGGCSRVVENVSYIDSGPVAS